ncbi:hypothetical protein CTI12_AA389070 [Artemisia annua]|uniref:Uncharacterized protein n=1 Tax=Artemisia annua TaxID=35608 RepID=A0A2U1ME39_ARTAN|nr:hypothetical protein CTI12_AA389070 [Artemisia annua]
MNKKSEKDETKSMKTGRMDVRFSMVRYDSINGYFRVILYWWRTESFIMLIGSGRVILYWWRTESFIMLIGSGRHKLSALRRQRSDGWMEVMVWQLYTWETPETVSMHILS